MEEWNASPVGWLGGSCGRLWSGALFGSLIRFAPGEAKRCNVAFMSPRDLLALVGSSFAIRIRSWLLAVVTTKKGIQSWL